MEEFRGKLVENPLSPYFVRLASLYYFDERYDECINLCHSGLSVYPNYLTAQVILLKALIKASRKSEAERLFKNLENKIRGLELRRKLQKGLAALSSDASKNEKPQELTYVGFIEFEKSIKPVLSSESSLSIEEYLNESPEELLDKEGFQNFLSSFNNYTIGETEVYEKPEKDINLEFADNDLVSSIKIVTETLADIFAQQGNYREAINIYQRLIENNHANSKNITDKMHILERKMLREDRI